MTEFASLNLIGRSPAFLAGLELIRKYATCDVAVLIQGETGTGKELAARAIHYLSRRRDFPFVGLNCGAIPDNLIETELFGYLRGAFTDARETRLGLIAQANGGTLFLDEVEAMSPRAQVALLRFLQDKEYRPIGGAPLKVANVRVLAASNIDLKALVARGTFRRDLLYRLDVLALRLAPLRERHGDPVLLAEAFVHRLNQQASEPTKTLHPDTALTLNRHSWPGNVRELENLIQREYLLARGRVIAFSACEEGTRVASDPNTEPFGLAKARAVAHFERAYLSALLASTGGNLSLAARVARKDRSDIGRLLRKHGIDRAHFLPGSPSSLSASHEHE
ncbi:MAG: sigma 54-interacting transcriptional regulator [Vicinamibacterales bacterium]